MTGLTGGGKGCVKRGAGLVSDDVFISGVNRGRRGCQVPETGKSDNTSLRSVRVSKSHYIEQKTRHESNNVAGRQLVQTGSVHERAGLLLQVDHHVAHLKGLLFVTYQGTT